MMYNLSNDHIQDYCTTEYGKVEVQYAKSGLFNLNEVPLILKSSCESHSATVDSCISPSQIDQSLLTANYR